MSDGAQQCVICGLASAIIVVVLLIVTCFDTLEPTEYGLNYNRFSKSFDREDVYEGGRYWIWFTNKFIEFPATQQTIEFSDSPSANSGPLRTRTQEGLALTLHISFQYKLIKEGIPALYDLSNLQYEQTFVRIARDIILQEAGSYQAPQYWGKRILIGNRMMELLDAAFQQAHARCLGIQVLKINLPPAFEQSIVDTQVEVQKTQMKQLEQNAEIVRQNIRVMTSETDQLIMVIDANARSRATLIQETARAGIWKETLDMESYVYGQVLSQLEFNADQMNTYQYFQALAGQPNKTLLVDIQNPIIQLVSSS